MLDCHAFRKAAIRYWERRRVIYNLALVPPAFFGYMFSAAVAQGNDPIESHTAYVLGRFALSIVGANICYTFAYALEFLFGSDDPTSRWLRFGRTALFVTGILFGMLLALIGGQQIAILEWHHLFNRAA